MDLDPYRPQDAPPRACDWPDCELCGEFRAPRSPDALREYRWFCLAHVRLYNQAWDFFRGKSQSEIEAHMRADVTWHRPTWRIGGQGFAFRDPFGLFDEEDGEPSRARARPSETKEDRMLAVLGLERDISLDDLKRRYKALAKQHHPDLHGGDKQAEERLKVINEAYTYLRGSGLFT
ncbi:J domain-containing protein [Marinivivus vitaminiproducens]|uniref:J domain-containing protein n=1 Tax=Marinivivus vitaminiproducens TaxID=3035935 RepID=UPI00279A693D|nr:J domain-containing protein [Geminicoccaceae bacterium SCSIO 64248]